LGAAEGGDLVSGITPTKMERVSSIKNPQKEKLSFEKTPNPPREPKKRLLAPSGSSGARTRETCPAQFLSKLENRISERLEEKPQSP